MYVVEVNNTDNYRLVKVNKLDFTFVFFLYTEVNTVISEFQLLFVYGKTGLPTTQLFINN